MDMYRKEAAIVELQKVGPARADDYQITRVLGGG